MILVMMKLVAKYYLVQLMLGLDSAMPEYIYHMECHTLYLEW